MLVSTLFVASLASAALATNDWNVPCFSGACSYDIPSGQNSAAAALQLWSTSNGAISDATRAGGWILLNGTSGASKRAGNSTTQTVRIVCASDDSDAAGCSHLTNNAVGKIVRMPQGFGTPFARVAAFANSPDQSVPASVAAQRNGTKPVVRQLTIDTNWSASNASTPVFFGVKAASAAPAGTDMDLLPNRVARRSRVRTNRGVNDLARRGLADDLKNAVSNAASNANDFSKTLNDTLDPINLSKSFNLLNLNANCAGGNIDVTADVDGQMTLRPSFGFAIAGTLVPPKVSDFSLTAGVSADVNSTLTLQADASGAPLNTGDISLFTLGLPGLDIPGILAVGPQFILKASANADLELDADMTVQMAFKVDDASATFPPAKDKPSKGSPIPLDTPLKLAVSPNVQANATVEGHIKPTLELGLTAFGTNVGVFVNLDASATVDMGLDAGGVAKKTVNVRDMMEDKKPMMMDEKNATTTKEEVKTTSMAKAAKHSVTVTVEKSTTTVKVKATETASKGKSTMSKGTSSKSTASKDTGSKAKSTETASASKSKSTSSSKSSSSKSSSKTSTSNDASASGSVQGCISMKLGIASNIGATGKFFDLFNENTSTQLFSKNFQLFSKCFGNAPPTLQQRDVPVYAPRAISKRSRALRLERRADLSKLVCPAANVAKATKSGGKPVTVVDQTVKAKAIKAVK